MNILWCVCIRTYYTHIYLSIKSNDMNMIINNNEKNVYSGEQQRTERARATDMYYLAMYKVKVKEDKYYKMCFLPF